MSDVPNWESLYHTEHRAFLEQWKLRIDAERKCAKAQGELSGRTNEYRSQIAREYIQSISNREKEDRERSLKRWNALMDRCYKLVVDLEAIDDKNVDDLISQFAWFLRHGMDDIE